MKKVDILFVLFFAMFVLGVIGYMVLDIIAG